jgi:hypothetical protein
MKRKSRQTNLKKLLQQELENTNIEQVKMQADLQSIKKRYS